MNKYRAFCISPSPTALPFPSPSPFVGLLSSPKKFGLCFHVMFMNKILYMHLKTGTINEKKYSICLSETYLTNMITYIYINFPVNDIILLRG